jgi:hypothetical protein
MTHVTTVTAQARLRPWLDEEEVKDEGGRNREMIVELNIYTLAYAG